MYNIFLHTIYVHIYGYISKNYIHTIIFGKKMKEEYPCSACRLEKDFLIFLLKFQNHTSKKIAQK